MSEEKEKSKVFQTVCYVVMLIIYFALIAGVTVLIYKCESLDSAQQGENKKKTASESSDSSISLNEEGDDVDGDDSETGDEICEKHTYPTGSHGVCSVCGYVYECVETPVDEIYVVFDNRVKVHNECYSTSDNTVYILKQGEEVRVVAELTNCYGNLWYKLEDGNYLPAKYMVKK